jgi:hypothetical protein
LNLGKWAKYANDVEHYFLSVKALCVLGLMACLFMTDCTRLLPWALQLLVSFFLLSVH